MVVRLLVLWLCFSVSSLSYSWNWAGHEIVANIAYANLHPAVKTKIDAFVQNFHNEYPEINSFAAMAVWPDLLHKQRIEIFNHWHYIDLAFSVDVTPLKDLRGRDNIIRAISLIEPVLQNPKSNRYEKARLLAFLIHFAGDLHQPLHAATRISKEHPFGDEGGNLFLINKKNYSTAKTNLHKMWDQGCYFLLLTSDNAAALLSQKIMIDYPEIFFGDAVRDINIDHWANESFQLAKNNAYHTEEGKALSQEYISTCQRIVEQRLALAGYRLAVLLNKLMD